MHIINLKLSFDIFTGKQLAKYLHGIIYYYDFWHKKKIKINNFEQYSIFWLLPNIFSGPGSHIVALTKMSKSKQC